MARNKYTTDEERRAARAEQHRQYRERHPERVKATEKASNEKRKEKHKTWRQQPHVKARERLLQRRRRLSRDNPDKMTEGNLRRSARVARLEESNPRNRAWLLGRPQPDCCEACGWNDGGIVFDHCHQRGVARGWLCNRCNSALGMVKDDISRLRKLIAYLERTRDGTGPQFTLSGI